MAFLYHAFDTGAIPPIEYHEGKAGEEFAVGELLTLGDTGVTKCTGAKAPTHLCVGPRQMNGTVPCTRVHHGIEYETELAVAPAEGAALKVGQKVTIHTDGMGVTATTASGVANIVYIEGQAVGDKVRVRF